MTGVFCLTDTEETRTMWNGNRFELLYTVVLSSKELRMELAVTNKGGYRQLILSSVCSFL